MRIGSRSLNFEDEIFFKGGRVYHPARLLMGILLVKCSRGLRFVGSDYDEES
jgi:hypothetical protein